MERTCTQCGTSFTGRSDKQFCSTACYQRHWYKRLPFPYERQCKACGAPFIVQARADANRQYCRKECAVLAFRKGSQVWIRLHPEKYKEYNNNRLAKNSDYWRDQARSERRRIIDMLGGKCVVCGVTNPVWLHVDYIPTCKGDRFRHSKALKFVASHVHLFRILCANHHTELTITGKIEGTDIVQ
jgi:hypothetical protein